MKIHYCLALIVSFVVLMIIVQTTYAVKYLYDSFSGPRIDLEKWIFDNPESI